MDEVVWSWAIGSIAVGIMAGLAGAGLLWRALTSGRGDDPVVRDTARALAIFLFLFLAVTGVVVAVSIVDRDELEQVPSDLLSYLPHVLAAGIIAIGGRAVALVAGSAVSRALGPSSGRVRSQAAWLVRVLITAAALVIALDQLGVDTTLLQITGAAVLFAVAAAGALLIGLGGRDVAGELAAGRYLQRMLRPGDRVVLDDVAGEVVEVHPATVELRLDDGTVRHVPNASALRAGPVIERE
jgi:small-conductance mechanosensitive channel